jgi:serine/threonine-protein kinase
MSFLDWLRPTPRKRRTRRSGARKGTRECADCRVPLPDAARFCHLCGGPVAEADGGATGALAVLRDRLSGALQGKYVVRDLLGAGGMGAVFLAEDLTLERTVAIKVLPSAVSGEPTVVERFQREAKTAARLDHPHIVPIHRVESEDGLHYFVMKHVDGQSLDALLRGGEPLATPFVARVLREAAAALGHAHKRGIVHRDVKPGNIMLDVDERVVLTDFGISKASAAALDNTTEEQLTEVGTVVGTPHYMAPEQALGRPVDGRADQYALGVVGFQMLTGALPFEGDSPHAIIHRHINDAPPRIASLRPDVPAALAATITRALAKAPSNRFATMEEFAAALEGAPGVAAGTPAAGTTPAGARAGSAAMWPAGVAKVSPTRVVAVGAGGGTSRLRTAMWLAAAVLIISGVAGAAGWLQGGSSTTGAPGAKRTAAAAAKPRRPSRTAAPAPARRSATTPPRATTSRPASSRPAPSRTATKKPAPAPARTARLEVTTKPAATVYLDGKRVGQTPLTGQTLTVGRTYQLRVERKGYKTRREAITPAKAGVIARRYVLEPVKR